MIVRYEGFSVVGQPKAQDGALIIEELRARAQKNIDSIIEQRQLAMNRQCEAMRPDLNHSAAAAMYFQNQVMGGGNQRQSFGSCGWGCGASDPSICPCCGHRRDIHGVMFGSIFGYLPL